jgi:hypothetical protein
VRRGVLVGLRDLFVGLLGVVGSANVHERASAG